MEIIIREEERKWKAAEYAVCISRRIEGRRKRTIYLEERNTYEDTDSARQRKRERERQWDTNDIYRHRNENTFCGPIHQIGCGMFRVISQPF